MPTRNGRRRRAFVTFEALELRNPLAGDIAGVLGVTAVEVEESSVPEKSSFEQTLEIAGKTFFTVQEGDELELRMELENGQSELVRSVPNYVLNPRDPCYCERHRQVVVGDNLYFTVTTVTGFEDVVGGVSILPYGDLELWKSDGTSAGTAALKKLANWRFDSRDTYADLRDGGNDRLLMAVTEMAGAQVWISDGTADGTQSAGQVFGSGFEPPLRELTEFGDGFVLMGAQDELNYGVWWTSTDSGGESRLLKMFDGSAFASKFWPRNFTVAGDLVFFTAPTAETGMELWVTDGTAEGTVLAADMLSGPEGSDPQNLVAGDERLYFSIVDNDRVSWWSVSTELPVSNSLPGDSDNNGTVDFNDFLVLSANFGKTVDSGPHAGDFDGNGIVDFSDFLVLSVNFGKKVSGFSG